MATTQFQVTGMTCAHCERSVSGEVSRLPGVESVEVSAGTGRLVVSSAVPLDVAAVIDAVGEAGYEAVPA